MFGQPLAVRRRARVQRRTANANAFRGAVSKGFILISYAYITGSLCPPPPRSVSPLPLPMRPTLWSLLRRKGESVYLLPPPNTLLQCSTYPRPHTAFPQQPHTPLLPTEEVDDDAVVEDGGAKNPNEDSRSR